MHTPIYSELAQVERAALSRGPRVRGLRGAGLGAGEGIGAFLVAYIAGGAALSVLIGVGVGFATTAKAGVYTALGLLGTEAAIVGGSFAYSQYQNAAHQSAMDAVARRYNAALAALPLATPLPSTTPVPGGPGNATCRDAPNYEQCVTCPPGTVKITDYSATGGGIGAVVRCGPASLARGPV